MTTSAAPTDRRAGGLRLRGHHIRVALGLYAVAIAFLGAVHVDGQFPDPVQLMPTRALGIERSLAVLDRGGPPLLAANPAWAGSSPPQGTSYFPVGSDDDPALYLYVPLIADALGTDDSLLIVKWIFIAAFALLLGSYPLVFYELFGSIAAGVAAPLIALHSFSYVYNTQFYWTPAWMTLALLPLLFVLARREWRARVVAAVCALVLVAGIASSFRGGAGVGFLLAALMLAVWKMPTLRSRVAVVALIVVSFLATNKAVFTGARVYRDHVVGKHVEEFHKTPWHNIYIGLSYIPNQYGITYSDSTAIAAAKRLDPKVDYLGRTYPRTMRRVVWNLAKRDPGFIFRNLEEKTGAIARDALDRYLLALLLVPAMMFLGGRASERRRWVALTLPSLVVGTAPPLLVLPLEQYELGWLAGWALLWLIGILWLIAAAEAAVLAVARSRGRLDWQSEAHALTLRTRSEATRLFSLFRRRDLLAYGTLVAVCALLLATRIPAPIGVNPNYYVSLQTAPLPSSTIHGRTIEKWTFSTGVPDRWQITSGTGVEARQGALVVVTTESRSAYQLQSPATQLPRGTYRGLVEGEIARGGLELGILDVPRDRWIQTSHFSFHQRLEDKLMHVEFSLDQPTRVQMILSNWADANSRSAWTLHEAAIVRR